MSAPTNPPPKHEASPFNISREEEGKPSNMQTLILIWSQIFPICYEYYRLNQSDLCQQVPFWLGYCFWLANAMITIFIGI